jgi:hypothetical protein
VVGNVVINRSAAKDAPESFDNNNFAFIYSNPCLNFLEI